MQPGLAKKYRRRHRILGSKALSNPVSTLGLDLPFLIVTSISLQAAAAMSLEMVIINMGTVLAAFMLCRILPKWIRPLVYLAVSTVFMLVASQLLSRMFPVLYVTLGVYIYLMAVNGMTFSTAMSIEKTDKLWHVLPRALKGTIAFAIAMFVTSLVREYFGSGTLWGNPVPHLFRISGLLMPFFGFILVGFLLAGTRFLNKRLLAFAISERARSDAALEMDERERL